MRELSAMLMLLLLCSIIIGTGSVVAQYTADGEAFPLASPIKIESPSNISYSSNELTLSVTFQFLLGPDYSNLSYSLDGEENVTIPLTVTQEPTESTRTYANGTDTSVNSSFLNPYIIRGEVALPSLSEGQHNVTVYARYLASQIVGLDKSTVYFTVNSNSELNPDSNAEIVYGLILLVIVIVSLTIILFKKKEWGQTT